MLQYRLKNILYNIGDHVVLLAQIVYKSRFSLLGGGRGRWGVGGGGGGGGGRAVEGAGHWKLQTSQPTLFGYSGTFETPLFKGHLYLRETKFGPGELIT